ncbi:major facilitator transporter [Corynebacterium suranareeae]|uniref:Major facilitator transporter n=1 Tax=Corynebacterium suranareeae TaxID=2506452 RepID=A0A169S353_9CORY|nr:MFS transporter [Corynebacterium suranareeae]BAU96982.1 major facilitator transporter [Corynebacterium suranareeae]
METTSLAPHITEAQTSTPVESPKSPKKAALASLLGSTLEYYDFVIYGTASALLFNHLFFPQGDPVVATIGSLASFGVAYIARPIGGLVMGHVGDRISRKTALMVTLMIMGIASISIGLLPTYGQIGIWATVLLLIARIAQGFSAGAEAAGASTLTMEHSPEGKRGFFTSSVMAGCSVGNVLAGLVFIPFLMLPEEHLMSWGWRVPFLLSALVLVVAYFVRTRLEEPPTEKAEKEAGAPALEVLRTQGIDVARVFFITFFAVVQTTFNVYALAYATNEIGIDRSFMVMVNTISLGLSIGTIPLAAWVSDRLGRKPVLLFGAIACAITTYFYFQAISEADLVMIFALCLVNQGLFYACWNGVWTIFFPEMFAAPVRYTGMAMGNQLGLIVVGFAPTIATALFAWNGWEAVVAFVIGAIALSAAVILTTKETAFTKLEDLGKK